MHKVLAFFIAAGCLASSALANVVVTKDGKQSDLWWEHTIVYQIYPRSFQDSNGDGTGDLIGNRQSKLLCLAMVLDPAHVMIKESNLDCPTLKTWVLKQFGFLPFTKVQWKISATTFPTFVTLTPSSAPWMTFKTWFKMRMREVRHSYCTVAPLLIWHNLYAGIKIIMDFVPNHSSDQHEWFQKSVRREEPYTDYYMWVDPIGYDENSDPIPPNNWVRQPIKHCNDFINQSIITSFG